MDARDALRASIALAAAIGTGYGIYGIQLFLRQVRTVFRPSRNLLANPGDFGQACQDVELRLEDSTPVRGWWIPNPASAKLVIWLPGSVGNISHDLSALALLIPLGASVVM